MRSQVFGHLAKGLIYKEVKSNENHNN